MVNKQRIMTFIGIVFIALMLNGIIAYSLYASKETMVGRGKVSSVNVDVYSDPACTIKLTEINWSYVDPDSSVPYSFYLKNAGSKDITLNMTTNGLAAYPWLGLTWNREGLVMTKNEVAIATIELAVSAEAPQGAEFTFDVIITGTG
jgi:hypothetical protein